MRPILALVAVLAAGAVLVVTEVGGSEGLPDEVVSGVGEVRAGSVAALAQCSDWNEGTEEERQETVDDVYAQLNQAGADGPTPDLPDDEAYALFERACASEFATGFRLYKIYARTAALSVLAE